MKCSHNLLLLAFGREGRRLVIIFVLSVFFIGEEEKCFNSNRSNHPPTQKKLHKVHYNGRCYQLLKSLFRLGDNVSRDTPWALTGALDSHVTRSCVFRSQPPVPQICERVASTSEIRKLQYFSCGK